MLRNPAVQLIKIANSLYGIMQIGKTKILLLKNKNLRVRGNMCDVIYVYSTLTNNYYVIHICYT